MANNDNNKDSAANTNKANEQQQETNSPRSNSNNQHQECPLPPNSPKCLTCGRKFDKWNQMLSHLRTHPEKEFRWDFPPLERGFSPERLAEGDQEELRSQLTPTLLKLAKETLQEMNELDQDGAGSLSRRTSINLNVDPQDSGASDSSSPSNDNGKGFDLNKPPKNDDNENGGGSSK